MSTQADPQRTKADPTVKPLTKWMLAICNAGAAGRAPWAYAGGRSLAVATWDKAHRAAGPQAALEAVQALALSHGLSLRKPGASAAGVP